ncbi:hypothetical protein [Aliiroseovarius sediminis]|uniref:hypothetical protein n=1 Tax=Aliiroseovarius sediminis TaxID=2925839 RepID=UPI001F5A5C35|nr:hypothetical protein [Aliiroseovarius sediminis]MCI2395009.1 hypothetical protein [Aliiroseovarius sediminis]
MPLTDAPLYSIYAGNNDFKPFTEVEEKQILAIVGEQFPSFTILPARGIFEGKELPTLLIQIASHDRKAVVSICRKLGHALNRRWIGMSEGGLYTSVPMK